jgi:tetratricopeptide (TPR) repeat protein
MFKRLFPILLTVIALVAGTAPAHAAPADTVLAFPFENVSKRAEYNWIGESFSEMLSELVDARGFTSVRPDERNLAYEREKLPPTAILTRATSIKVGERAGADMIIVGTYRVDGDKNSETLTATARLIDIREGRIVGNEFNRGGQLKDLQRIQGELAYDILFKRNPALPFSRDQFINDASRIPTEAFSDFMKAILTSDRQNKIAFLERAVDTYAKKAQGAFTQAVFELGRIYYLDNDWDDTIKWLARVESTYPRSNEAAFYLGVAYLNTKKTDKAVETLAALVPRMPLFEVYNNAGVAYLRAGRMEDAITYLKPAAAAATRDADTQFNYGYALWLKNDFAGVVAQMENTLKRKATDGEAFYLLAKANERLGKQTEAAAALDQAKRHLASFAQWETKRQIPDLARVKTRFSKTAYYRLQNDARDAESASTSVRTGGASAAAGGASAVDEALQRARDHFAANRDREALDELARILQVRPDSYEAHFLRGRVYERRGEYDKGLEALKAATFWNPRLLQAYVILGRIHVLQKNCAEAQSASTKALQIDPTSSEAVALKRLVESKCAK